jgi:cobaltochelatase CobN
MFNCVIILTRGEPFDAFRTAKEALEQRYPGNFGLSVYDMAMLDLDGALFDECLLRTNDTDFIFIYVHGTITDFKGWTRYSGVLENRKLFFHTSIEDENNEMMCRMNLYPPQYQTILRYYQNADSVNITNMLLYVASAVTHSGEYACEQPAKPKWDGIYDDGQVADEEQYIEKVARNNGLTVGILFHWYNFSRRDMEHVNAVMARLRELGVVPYCVYTQVVPDAEMGFGGARATLQKYFMREGRVIIDALVNLAAFSMTVLANPGNGSGAQAESIFEMLDVPVFQAMVTAYHYEEWQKAPAGIPPTMISYHIVQPEFDGQLITFPVAYTETRIIDGSPRARPIAERVDKLCRLVINWARLRKIPKQEKKIAIIFHNMPPRNDTIGCASGLDTPVSVFNLVRELERDGVVTAYPFRDGQEIIAKIIEGVTNDGRWSSPEQTLERSAATVDKEHYLCWFNSFPEDVQVKLSTDWGAPPGTFMAVNDQILIPGILNGNIFIGLQPNRAAAERAEELMHSTDIVCPHQYPAFYRWISEVFGAHAIVHVGTHGTLEWLPGKEVGLCESCYPDVAIHTLPNIYPYIISNPGEGTQAKRRSYCTIIDHLIPSMTESGIYDELTDLDAMMKEYYHCMVVDKERTAGIAKRIWALAKECHITVDLELDDAERDQAGCVDKIHNWVSRIQSHEIRDGLHIFGEAPKDERLCSLARVLLRVKNGDTPSMREGLAAAGGFDLNRLLDFPSELNADGKTNAMLLEELDEAGRALFEQWRTSDYREGSIDGLLAALPFAPHNLTPLRAALAFAAQEVVPRLAKTTRELDSFIGAFNGRMAPIGQSGNPTRGNVHLLPTGKNFYAIDPAAIPTRAAWDVGVLLGRQLLERYLKDEGRLPEHIAILVYATDTMRTNGDDIAEILYLLGLRPQWLGNSDRVIGFEPIPLEELARPRIDVTLRITGLLRDTFPNLIERIEDAVNFVASLAEPSDMNYVKKHIEKDAADLIAAGVERDAAYQRAGLRIFGDPPGTYGAGVAELVEAKKWESTEDLGKIYTFWGGHGYGKKLHGENFTEDFARRLSSVDVSVKNESSIEHDMLGSDDFYNYFGGLVSAVRTHSGEQRRAFIPNSANKERTEIFSLHEEASKVMRARINNPKWIAGLKQHGYKGAQDISEMTDIVFGWDATTGVIDDWMYKAIADRYAFNEENAAWIRSVNIYAMQNIAERLLEAISRGMWNASTEDSERLRAIYMDVEGDIEGLN